MALKYKILVAVTAEAERFKNCVSKCPDKTKLIIINNWDNNEVGKLCDELKSQGAEVQNYPQNIGFSGAINVGFRKVYTDNLDYMMVLSPSCLFTNSVNDFVNIIDNEEAKQKNYYYLTVANEKTDLHAFAVMKKCLDEIGLYDENFFPVYYDDTDYGYRMQLANVKKTLCYPPRTSQTVGGAVASDYRIFDLYWSNVNHIHDYYVRKWGGEYNQEKFKTPFNDPTKTIKDWTIEEDKIVRRIL